MDRFIAFPIDQKGCEGDHLKSNMDRFIERRFWKPLIPIIHLKSNMDRFIVHTRTYKKSKTKHLKSNMDRFIGSPLFNFYSLYS